MGLSARRGQEGLRDLASGAAAKDDLALNWTAEQAIAQPGEYWHMLPEASQGRKVIWDAVNSHTGLPCRIDQAFPKRIPRESTREQEGWRSARLTGGSLWRVVGSDNYDRPPWARRLGKSCYPNGLLRTLMRGPSSGQSWLRTVAGPSS